MFIHSEVVAAIYYFRKLRIYFKHERAYFNTPGNQRGNQWVTILNDENKKKNFDNDPLYLTIGPPSALPRLL